MILASVFDIDRCKINIDEKELRRRLCVKGDCDCSEALKRLPTVMECISPRCSYVRLPALVSDTGVDFGVFKAESRDLAKNLCGCKEACIFSVTLGLGADRLLQKLSKISPAEHFICDALLSAIAENVCDIAEEEIKKEKCRPRYCIGYGDLDLCVQKDVLSVLSAGKNLGITLSDSYLMTPQKSITAIMGILEEE